MNFTQSLLQLTGNLCRFSSMVNRSYSKHTLNSLKDSLPVYTETSSDTRKYESSLDECDSDFRWEIRKSIEIGCPTTLREMKYGSCAIDGIGDEYSYNNCFRRSCQTLETLEDRKDSAREVLWASLEKFADCLSDEYADRHMWRNITPSEPKFWLACLRFSKEKNCIELKQTLREAGVKELNFSRAIAKVYDYFEHLYPYRNIKVNRSFGPDEIVQVLKYIDLSDTEFESTLVLLSSNCFKNQITPYRRWYE